MGLRFATGEAGVRERVTAGPPVPGAGRRGDKGGAPGAFSALRLAFYRLTRGWRLLAGVLGGILVAVILLCTIPLYDSLVAGVQLQKALVANSPQARNVQIQLSNDHIATAFRDEADPSVRALGQQYLRAFTDASVTYYVTSGSMPLLQAGAQQYDPTSAASPQLTFRAFDYAAASSHMHVLAGALPTGGNNQAGVTITKDMANILNIQVGGSLRFSQFGDHTQQIELKVIGIWQPTDPADPYWNGLSFSLQTGADTVIYPMLISFDTFFGTLAQLQHVSMAQNWVYYTRADQLDDSNMQAASDNIGRFKARLSGQVASLQGVTGLTTGTNLDHIIGDISGQQALLALPLYVIVAQVIGLTLIFIAGMGALLIEGQGQEIATLKSRGASGLQVVAAFTIQAAVVALLALAAGPFLAALLAIELVRWLIPGGAGGTSGVQASYLAHIANPGAVVLPALAGAALGVGAVAFSAWQSARGDILAHRREQGRQMRAPFWRRYYVDVALAALCLVGFLELGQFGGIQTRGQLSGGGVSPLLLVTPGLLLLAGSLLILRLFPFAAAFCARLANRGKGATPLLAMAQVERSPARYTRMMLLLALAVGLGLFALSFDASLGTNGGDRAAYRIGADVRVTELNGVGEGHANAVAKKLAAMPGVTAVSPVYRSQARTPSDEGGNQVDVLGIEPETFGQALADRAWRDDYAAHPLSTLLSGMKAHEGGASATSGRLWAVVSAQFAAQHRLKVGDQFALIPVDSLFATVPFTVGGVVSDFPTLYPMRAEGSFIVVDSHDLLAAIIASQGGDPSGTLGPNEFWLRTSGNAQHSALLQAIESAKYDLNVERVDSLSDALNDEATNPVTAGIRGLLLIGAITAALLAIIGTVAQTVMAARQRTTQFSVLRTLGLSRRNLRSVLLAEQLVVYTFGLVGGTVLGLVLSSAVLPFLQFSDTTVDPSQLGIPPYQLTLNLAGSAIFYAALIVAFSLALVLASRAATNAGISKALRIGED